MEEKNSRWRGELAILRAFKKFIHRQFRSVAKRCAEAEALALRAAVLLGWTKRMKRLRDESKLIRESGLLNEPWYGNTYSDLLTRKTDIVLHYLRRGAAQGCWPNEVFDTGWYLEQNPEVAAAGVNPLLHYIQIGWREGRQPSPQFNLQSYLECYPEVAAAGLEPLSHYLRVGSREKRPLDYEATAEFSSEPEDPSGWPLPDVRLIAFYLPQFHRIPENDTWWGEGFTEWTNVRRGTPHFQDHYQPHVPHPEVGYYDLTDGAVLERQVRMARRFGIHGFCFYYYWFGGKRLLEMPLERLVSTKRPEFPFCFCWANENWTRQWDGSENEILMPQRYSAQSDQRFIRDLLPVLQDKRYIRINGRPLLLIYRPLSLPKPKATFKRWRQTCRAEGLGELFLAGIQASGSLNPRMLELDAAVDFPPHIPGLRQVPKEEYGASSWFQGSLFDYKQARLIMQSRRLGRYCLWRTVMPSWDNTARRKQRGTIFVNATPQDYYQWLRLMIRETRTLYPSEQRLVFINAWNEWAEGCHLEPDHRYGFAWLNATRRALLPDGNPQHSCADTGWSVAARHEPDLSKP
jgi:hypothetical protein